LRGDRDLDVGQRLAADQSGHLAGDRAGLSPLDVEVDDLQRVLAAVVISPS